MIKVNWVVENSDFLLIPDVVVNFCDEFYLACWWLAITVKGICKKRKHQVTTSDVLLSSPWWNLVLQWMLLPNICQLQCFKQTSVSFSAFVFMHHSFVRLLVWPCIILKVQLMRVFRDHYWWEIVLNCAEMLNTASVLNSDWMNDKMVMHQLQFHR